jgi:hypothetical protein
MSAATEADAVKVTFFPESHSVSFEKVPLSFICCSL